MNRIATTFFLAGMLLWPACSSKKSGTDEPQAPQPAQPVEPEQPTGAVEPEQPTAQPTMTDNQSALDRINELLAKHPAAEELCGEKRSVLSVDGGQLVLESTWSACPGGDRSTAPLAELDPDTLEAELIPDYGQARIYIPCRGDKACSGRFTREKNEGEWRHLRDESTFTVDCGPDENVMKELASQLRTWLKAGAK